MSYKIRRDYPGRATLSLTLERVLELVQGEAGFSFQPAVRYAAATPLRAHYDALRNTLEIVFDSPSIGWSTSEGQQPTVVELTSEGGPGAEEPARFFQQVYAYLAAHPDKRAGVRLMAQTVLAVDAALGAQNL